MKVGLLIPCYVDGFFPEVGVATLVLLERPATSGGRRRSGFRNRMP